MRRVVLLLIPGIMVLIISLILIFWGFSPQQENHRLIQIPGIGDQKITWTPYLRAGDSSYLRLEISSFDHLNDRLVIFDGNDDNGYPVPDGEYAFSVRAVDDEGFPVVVDSGLSGKVTAVTYQGDTPYLVVGDHLINPKHVTEVGLGPTP